MTTVQYAVAVGVVVTDFQLGLLGNVGCMNVW